MAKKIVCFKVMKEKLSVKQQEIFEMHLYFKILTQAGLDIKYLSISFNLLIIRCRGMLIWLHLDPLIIPV